MMCKVHLPTMDIAPRNVLAAYIDVQQLIPFILTGDCIARAIPRIFRTCCKWFRGSIIGSGSNCASVNMQPNLTLGPNLGFKNLAVPHFSHARAYAHKPYVCGDIGGNFSGQPVFGRVALRNAG